MTYRVTIKENSMCLDSIHRSVSPYPMADSNRQFHAMKVWIAMLAAAVLMLSGCTMVGPDMVKPEAPVMDDWQEKQMPGLATGKTDYSSWWRTFKDPVLDSLVERAYQQNLSLQIAAIRIYEARAHLGIMVGQLYPQQQSGFGSISNNRIPEGENGFIDGSFNQLSLGFDATWELDIWGKYRRSVESGVANLEASVAGFDDILVTLTAEVARTYILIRTLEQRLRVAEENVAIQEGSLRIASIRFKEGVVTELDVAQAKALLNETQALVPRLESGLRQAQNALAVLLGVVPGELQDMLGTSMEIPEARQDVVIDIPANLLRRRPDIRLSESQIAAQSPQIGIAKADLYPQFFLFGTIGWRSSDANTLAGQNSLGDLFNSKSLFWSAGPGFNWDILNYGRIKNRVRVEDARFQQLVVDYKNTVLKAQREVEDAIVAYTRAREEETFLRESVAAAQRSVDLSMVQYKEGITDYQRVLDSQRLLAAQADRLTEVRGQVGTNLVATYKALGGGWQIRQGKEILSEANKKEMMERTSWGGLLETEKVKESVENKEDGNWLWPDW